MRAVLVVLLALLPFAGCLDGDDRPQLRAFTAVYEMEDGYQVEVRLEGPRDVIGPDGQVRPVYSVATKTVVPNLPNAGWHYEDLDATLRVVRQQGCYSFREGGGCAQESIDFLPYSDHPNWGIGLPFRLPTEREGGLLRVADPLDDSTDVADLAEQYYEYKPGEIWPQAYVRASEEFDVRIELFRLVSVEPGPILSGAALWPTWPTAQARAPVDDLYPSAGKRMVDQPFSVAEAYDALRAHGPAAESLRGGCLVQMWLHRDRSGPPGLVDPPPLLGGEWVGSVLFTVANGDGIESLWQVVRVRDTLGQESWQVDGGDDTRHSGFQCAERLAAQVGLDDYLGALPPQFQGDEPDSFIVTWWTRTTPEGRGPSSMPLYSAGWSPPEGGPPRSATMDASTGWWTEFSYVPGERLDP